MNRPPVLGGLASDHFANESGFSAGQRAGIISKCVIGGNPNAPKIQSMNALRTAGNGLGELVQKIANTKVVQAIGRAMQKTPSTMPKQNHAKP